MAELNDLKVALYRCLLEKPKTRLTDFAVQLGRPISDLNKPCTNLSEMGLIHMNGNETLTAINPLLAETTILKTKNLELKTQQASIKTRRNTIRQLVPN